MAERRLLHACADAIDRVYDAGRIERRLGFRCGTSLATVLDALREGASLPFAHDPGYVLPKERG